jgi:hypothetical protein
VEGNPGSWFGRWLCRGLAATALVFLVLWLAGLGYYTSVGWDTERAVGGYVWQDYYRIRWPGNGGLWVGAGGHRRTLSRGPVRPFDPASTFFDRPRWLPEAETAWNRFGWWWLEAPAVDPSDGPGGARLVWGWWVGVPGWLPAVVLGLWPTWVGYQRLYHRLTSRR